MDGKGKSMDELDYTNNALVDNSDCTYTACSIPSYCTDNSSPDTANFYHFMQYPHGSVSTTL